MPHSHDSPDTETRLHPGIAELLGRSQRVIFCSTKQTVKDMSSELLLLARFSFPVQTQTEEAQTIDCKHASRSSASTHCESAKIDKISAKINRDVAPESLKGTV